MLTDDALARRLAHGDRDALDEVYRRHAPALRRYARRFVSPCLAEDAVHDALAGTQAALLGTGRVVDLKPWLYRCVRNACLSELDRAGRRCEELGSDRAAGDADPAEAADRRQRLRSALTALGELPHRQREALVARAIGGAGYGELARRFAITENASVQLVHRARRNLALLAA